MKTWLFIGVMLVGLACVAYSFFVPVGTKGFNICKGVGIIALAVGWSLAETLYGAKTTRQGVGALGCFALACVLIGGGWSAGIRDDLRTTTRVITTVLAVGCLYLTWLFVSRIRRA